MTFLSAAFAFLLSINPTAAWAPATIDLTVRFPRPVLGEVCFQAEAVSDNAEIFHRSSCEGIDGHVKRLRWNWPWVGEYRVRATFRGGSEYLTSPYQRLIVRPPLG